MDSLHAAVQDSREGDWRPRVFFIVGGNLQMNSILHISQEKGNTRSRSSGPQCSGRYTQYGMHYVELLDGPFPLVHRFKAH